MKLYIFSQVRSRKCLSTAVFLLSGLWFSIHFPQHSVWLVSSPFAVKSVVSFPCLYLVVVVQGRLGSLRSRAWNWRSCWMIQTMFSGEGQGRKQDGTEEKDMYLSTYGHIRGTWMPQRHLTVPSMQQLPYLLIMTQANPAEQCRLSLFACLWYQEETAVLSVDPFCFPSQEHFVSRARLSEPTEPKVLGLGAHVPQVCLSGWRWPEPLPLPYFGPPDPCALYTGTKRGLVTVASSCALHLWRDAIVSDVLSGCARNPEEDLAGHLGLWVSTVSQTLSLTHLKQIFLEVSDGMG